uniref:UspA domain-containing protein n=1 Tax=Polytomella parva TaxID=51329 RepID=A0A7S0VC41_9CHLO|eukprot:CAMPEP_0175042928 /NCGR_PEP_ID=MMETSP0052_2-20121109/2866_1 /TAXON_ID=51329 ORGANISM="Polytomella parva, Strain SAG 63-3" /NCGR_SAMPLE_ID=MMETSP0052_2 /ASSEMBLY_ACC=CAM_ASM_000194 /LENGTH=165 /DNA_ID=CAMNT_0016305855 /DNA_START=58 /DNA_END=555 /DNA_ORIENTATION=+
MSRNICICVDESKASVRAIEWAIENVVRSGDSVTLLHVVPLEKYVVMSTDLGELVDEGEDNRHKVEARENVFVERDLVPLLAANNIPVKIEAIKANSGEVGEGISRFARANSPAMLVLSRHDSHHGTAGAIRSIFAAATGGSHGSASDYCLSHCRTPIVVLHLDN